jgi:hypothetical protein
VTRINPFILSGAGVTRYVVLVGSWAIKVPRHELRLAAVPVRAAGEHKSASSPALAWPELCPVLFSLPGGWVVVMRRARVMTDAEFESFDVKAWAEHADRIIPVEAKSDSFGWLGDRLVAIDYGT